MNLQLYIAAFIEFLNSTIIPFMLGMAFLAFVINVIRFFVIGSSSPDSQAKAKSLAVYGIGAFVFIIVFWGIVGLLSSSLGLNTNRPSQIPSSDYVPRDFSPSDCRNGGPC
jgi:hypothetical protein